VDYKDNDTLIPNPYSWHTVSNLLFLESPAGVGYSYNTDSKLEFNDSLVAKDSLNALVDFFGNGKFGEYVRNDFWLAGESYAGKYIPDLAVEIDKYNRGNPIVTILLKGQLVGNGVITFEGGDLQTSQTDFMLNH
jgi:carboxypeptidase C (cathepsin A)